MNTELTHITDWFRANKLSLNVSKTNYMLYSLPKHQITKIIYPLITTTSHKSTPKNV